MKQPMPMFKLARVYDDGSGSVVIVPINNATMAVTTDRRGLLRTAVTASTMFGMTGCDSERSDSKPNQAMPRPKQPSSAAPTARSLACLGSVAHSDTVRALAISSDGATIVSGADDGYLKIWNRREATLVKSIGSPGDAVKAVVVSPDSRFVVIGGAPLGIAMRALGSGQLLKTLSDRKSLVYALAISPDGKWLASGGDDGTIQLWSLPDGVVRKILTGHKKRITSLSISPDGRTLVSASGDETVKLWSLPASTLLRTLSGHSYWVSSLAISPNGQTLASGGFDGSIRLWSLAEGKHLTTLKGHTQWVGALAMSLDGKTLASGSGDASIRIWDLQSSTTPKTLSGHGNWVNALVFAPDGQMLFSGGADNSIKIWALPEYEVVACLSDPVAAAAVAAAAIRPPERPRTSLQDSQRPIALPDTTRSYGGGSQSGTAPCGSPIPLGAICTCNCVPVCQAHRLLSADAMVRRMAEQLLLTMGPREFAYMRWAADTAVSSLRSSIHAMMDSISRGMRANLSTLPDLGACASRLVDSDDVIAVMAAQSIRIQERRVGACSAFEHRIAALILDSRVRPWFVRHAVNLDSTPKGP